MEQYQYIILFIIIILITQAYRIHQDTIITEHWDSYQSAPYGEMSTGTTPLTFYERNSYRKPYRWPFTFESSYPEPHLQPYSD